MPGLRLRFLIALTIVIVVIAMLYRFNPVEQSLLPRCLFKSLTGLSCPGCGMQRFFHAATHGHIAEAVGYNAFMPFVITYTALFAAERIAPDSPANLRLREVIEGRTMTTLLAAAIPLWLVLRNVLGI